MVLRGGGARARSWGKSLSGARERAVAQPRVCSSLRWSGEGNGDRSHHCLHSNYDDRYRYFYGLLRGAALSEPMVREDVALRAVTAGSAVEFSPEEMEQHLQRCVDELRIQRSRGNVYFV